MLTVKYKSDDGQESVEEATKVWSKRDTTSMSSDGSGSPLVIYAETGGTVREYRGPGTVYVMNDAGQTVGRYTPPDYMRAPYKYSPAPTAAELTLAAERADDDLNAMDGSLMR